VLRGVRAGKKKQKKEANAGYFASAGVDIEGVRA